MSDLIRIKRGNKADIPELMQGELGFTLDEERLYVGGINGNVKIPSTKDIKYENVCDYGAKGDGIVDDTTAINLTISAIVNAESVLTKKPVLFFPFGTGYKTTASISIPTGISVIMESPILYAGVLNESALVIGEAGVPNLDVVLVLRVRKVEQSDWLNDSCVGIQLVNLYHTTNVHIVESNGFTIPLQCVGKGSGFVYNIISLGYLVNGKYGCDLTNETYNAKIGWCNENLFIGGRWSVTTGTNRNKSRYGVRITSKDGTYTDNDNNLFVKPSFELNLADMTEGEAIPILLEHATYNEFSSIRTEGNSLTVARSLNSSAHNNISIGYGIGTLDDQSIYPTSDLITRRFSLINKVPTLVYKSPALHKVACYADGATMMNVPGVHLASSSNANVYAKTDLLTPGPNYLTVGFGRGVGIFVDTRNNKRFIVRRDIESATNGGRIAVQCYDVNGVILTSAGANHPYVKGASNQVLSWSTNSGGYYTTSSDYNSDLYFKVHDDVKYVRVLIMRGSNDLFIRGFSIYSVDAFDSACWTGYEEIVPGVNLGTTPPTAGTWEVGRRIINMTPTVGQPKSWICTVAGTPGTWVSEGNL
jgi:hypothetical protein